LILAEKSRIREGEQPTRAAAQARFPP